MKVVLGAVSTMTSARALLVVAALLPACGPDVADWKGAWTGAGSFNAGRQPVAVVGTLAVTDGARFVFVGTVQGSASPTYTAGLAATSIEGARVLFQGPLTTDLVAAPADGCTRQLTIDEGTLTRAGTSFEGVVRGKAKSDCAGGSSVSETFQLEVSGNRQP